MKTSSSYCTTLTNGQITSCIKRSKPLTVPMPIIHTSSPSSIESITKVQIIIRKNRQEQSNSTRYSISKINSY